MMYVMRNILKGFILYLGKRCPVGGKLSKLCVAFPFSLACIEFEKFIFKSCPCVRRTLHDERWRENLKYS